MIWDFDTNPQPRQDEFLACSKGNLEKLIQLDFSKAANIVNGFNGLHVACKKGHTSIVKYLIQKSLMTTATINDQQCYIPPLLLSHTEGSQSKSGCMLAAFAGHLDIVKLFYEQNDELANALNQDMDDSGNSILHYSTWGGCLEVTKYLIEQGHADFNHRNKEGMTSLQFAAAGNHVNIVEYLTTINKTNQSINCITTAATTTTTTTLCTENRVFNELTNYNDDLAELSINADTSNSGLTTFHRAIQSGSLETIEYLLKKHCSSSNHHNHNNYNTIRMNDNNNDTNTANTSTQSAPSSSSSSYVNMASLNGTTGLHLACRHGHLKIATCLLQHGANINQQNDYLLTPLHYACIGGYTQLVQYLIESSSSSSSSLDTQTINYDTQSSSSSSSSSSIDLSSSSSSSPSSLDIHEIKIKECADVRLKLSEDVTCLQLAAQYGKHDICELIISHLDRESDNLLQKDAKGETAISAALASGYRELASKVLTKHALAQLRAQNLLSQLMMMDQNQ